MNKLKIIAVAFLMLTFVTSCDDFLGDNKNPNRSVTVTPDLVLPNALVRTADLVRAYNDAGSWIVGYIVNAGGFGGFGSVVTYNYTTGDHQGLWAATYDDLNNYQYILNNTNETGELAYFNAAARVMKAFNYQLLVDFFGDVPYFDALKGTEGIVVPAYDDQVEIYQDLVVQLDQALAVFTNSTLIARPMGTADVLFGGNTTRWAQFANTLKLRLLVRMASVTGLNPNFAGWSTTVGVLQDDALINPGYLSTAGKLNPYWAQYHSDAAGTAAGNGRSRIPSTYVFSFYDGNKLTDTYRKARVYRSDAQAGQLGNQDDSQPLAPTGATAWYVGTGTANAVGLLKGRTAGMPIMLSAEGYFLLAEAQLNGDITAADQGLASFDMGMLKSFTYLSKDAANVVVGNPATGLAGYKTENEDSPREYLVNYALGTTEEKLEAIITQKYIALNFIHGHEAWSEYRRTAYPRVTLGSGDPVVNFASKVSTSTRPDKLPIRVKYASTEYQLNPENVPDDSNGSQFTDAIFFQKN